ncbi:MAG: hypothetical protein J6W06_09420, partial [Bacteroidales bacterium]|nr:hypothetical protein [Bacteroidales bacterium]
QIIHLLYFLADNNNLTILNPSQSTIPIFHSLSSLLLVRFLLVNAQKSLAGYNYCRNIFCKFDKKIKKRNIDMATASELKAKV